MLFNKAGVARIERLESTATQERYQAVLQQYDRAFEQRRQVAQRLIQERHSGGNNPGMPAKELQEANRAVEEVRQEGIQLLRQTSGGSDYDDTNYIFLTFVTTVFPVGTVGLIIAA